MVPWDARESYVCFSNEEKRLGELRPHVGENALRVGALVWEALGEFEEAFGADSVEKPFAGIGRGVTRKGRACH